MIRGDVAHGLRYTIRRGDGDTLGENEIQYASEPDPGVHRRRARAGLAARPPAWSPTWPTAGIRYVVLPSPADGDVAAGLDATDGLVQASAESRTTRAWQVGAAGRPARDGRPGSRPRAVLLVVQGIALLVVLVLCLPTWRASRRRSDERMSPRQARPRARGGPPQPHAAARPDHGAGRRASPWSPWGCSRWSGSRRCTTPTSRPR